ncbi:MAG: tryptophan--tRNA ligase [Oscillospiraceae bacterium]|jgi:tryptophanyl-tRNA synthetase|nr:tryptophan--tRNA ligase [Oscillospiraceae bacterium]
MKRILSGIQPTSIPHLGNYLGALKNWASLGADGSIEPLYFIADLHSLTVKQNPADLRQNSYKLYAILLAMGINPEKSAIFCQSHVKEHAELSWVLSCYTQFGELSRMTQFKDKSGKHPDNINAGLFTYPVLMAADILIYKSDLVPVGADQKQHLEIARDIATRFNGLYGDVFTLPEPYIPKEAARVRSLSEPDKKMSKSDENKNGVVFVTDDRNTIIKKFKRAVTDSEAIVEYRPDDPAKAGVNNLLAIYAAASGKTIEEATAEFSGGGYGALKTAVGEAVADMLAPLQSEYTRLYADHAYIETCMKQGAERAAVIARETLREVYDKVGLYLS